MDYILFLSISWAADRTASGSACGPIDRQCAGSGFSRRELAMTRGSCQSFIGSSELSNSDSKRLPSIFCMLFALILWQLTVASAFETDFRQPGHQYGLGGSSTSFRPSTLSFYAIVIMPLIFCGSYLARSRSSGCTICNKSAWWMIPFFVIHRAVRPVRRPAAQFLSGVGRSAWPRLHALFWGLVEMLPGSRHHRTEPVWRRSAGRRADRDRAGTSSASWNLSRTEHEPFVGACFREELFGAGWPAGGPAC